MLGRWRADRCFLSLPNDYGQPITVNVTNGGNASHTFKITGGPTTSTPSAGQKGIVTFRPTGRERRVLLRDPRRRDDERRDQSHPVTGGFCASYRSRIIRRPETRVSFY